MPNPNMVTLRLAHPLKEQQAARLHAVEVKEYPRPGMEITLPESDALALINAGYASGIDPGDTEAVRAALKGGKTTVKSGKAAS